jgi:ATP-dependent DNA helicase DinG
MTTGTAVKLAVSTTTIPSDPTDPAWGYPLWPAWITGFRSQQLDLIEEIVGLYRSGVDVVELDAPTGTGKTIIAEAVRRIMGFNKSLYIANTNSLLDQFHRDFPYAKPLKGRTHYPTLDAPEKFGSDARFALTAADCDRELMFMSSGCDGCSDGVDDPNEKMHCTYCHPYSMCPYVVARKTAMADILCITNTSYFISDIGLGKNSGFRGENARDLVIVDECDTLESILMGHVEVSISKRQAQQLKLSPPSKKTVASAWVEWLNEEALPVTLKARQRLAGDESMRLPSAKRKELATIDRLREKLRRLETELERDNVVYDGYNDGDIRFKPIKVDNIAPEVFWPHGRKWLAMSATLFADEFNDSLGLENTALSYAVVRAPSTFDVERRPVYYRNYGDNTFKNRETAWPGIIRGVRDVLTARPDARVLVHTVSYGFTTELANALGDMDRPIIWHTTANERQACLDKLRATPAGVLLSPSMDRGVDLPGDQCDVIIITKMPFPSTKDKQIQARMYTRNGQSWYSTQVIKSLVQMTGRGMRSAEDVCETFILDGQFFSNVWGKNRRLIPEWWAESVDFKTRWA